MQIVIKIKSSDVKEALEEYGYEVKKPLPMSRIGKWQNYEKNAPKGGDIVPYRKTTLRRMPPVTRERHSSQYCLISII